MSQAECSRLFAWNARRRFLYGGLARAITNLQQAGCRTIIIDGSFVTARELPNNWDAAFDPVGVIYERLDPILVQHKDGGRAMRAKYLGNLFPWTETLAHDGPLFLDYFQTDHDGQPKGVIELRLQVMQ